MTGRRFTVPAEGGTLFPAVRQAENIRFRQSGTCCRPEIFSEKRNASDALRPVGHFRSRSGLRSGETGSHACPVEAVSFCYGFGKGKENDCPAKKAETAKQKIETEIKTEIKTGIETEKE